MVYLSTEESILVFFGDRKIPKIISCIKLLLLFGKQANEKLRCRINPLIAVVEFNWPWFNLNLQPYIFAFWDQDEKNKYTKLLQISTSYKEKNFAIIQHYFALLENHVSFLLQKSISILSHFLVTFSFPSWDPKI